MNAARRGRCLAVLSGTAAILGGCAAEPPPPPVRAAVPGRLAADDSELVGLIPTGTETLFELDMAALRGSPWARPILDASSPEERARKLAARGFDELEDVDRAAFGGVARPGVEAATLAAVQGRFDQARAIAAFRATAPGATTVSWRGVSLWQDGDRAIGFLTPRTFLSGPPAAVRAAIDCAFGVVPDVRADAELGQLRRALDGTGSRATLRFAAIVTDELRAQIRQQLDAPESLRRIGARLDLGSALDLDVVGILDTPRDAAALAGVLASMIRDLRARPELQAFGLAGFLDTARLAAQGSRVVGGLHLSAERLPDLTEKLAAVAQIIGGAASPRPRAAPSTGGAP